MALHRPFGAPTDDAAEDSAFSTCPSPDERLRELRASGPVEVVAFHRHQPPEGEPTAHVPQTRQGLPVGPWACSQWFASAFAVDGESYPNAEVFMMIEKARLFSDHAVVRGLMRTTEPGRASPTDRVWEVGLAADDPRVVVPAAWRGTNHLGLALMEVRERLRRPVTGPA